MALVGCVTVGGSLLGDRAWSAHVRRELDETTAEEAREFIVAAAVLESDSEMPGFAESYFRSHQHGEPARIFLLRFNDGTVLSLHLPADKGFFPPDLPAPVPDTVTVSTLRAVNGDTYRLAAVSVVVQGKELGAFYVAEPTAPVEALVNDHARDTLLYGLGGLAVAGVGAYVIARFSLSPIRKVTRTARSISQQDLSRRLNYQGAGDEVGELATAFDSMIERLDRAFSEQRRLMADLSHQLRTPITIVRGHLDLLRRHRDWPREDSMESVETAIDELDRMNRLVGDLLRLARTAAADFLKPSSLALRPFLQELMLKAYALAPRTWVLGSVPGLTLTADSDQLMGAFLNLLQNAVDHTQPSDSIGLKAVLRDGGVEIAVWDTGEGIAPQDLDRIFERFYRAQASPGAAGRGSGLGLTIVEAVVRAHGGSVQVDSRAGGGTIFTVRLPAPPSVQAADRSGSTM